MMIYWKYKNIKILKLNESMQWFGFKSKLDLKQMI